MQSTSTRWDGLPGIAVITGQRKGSLADQRRSSSQNRRTGTKFKDFGGWCSQLQVDFHDLPSTTEADNVLFGEREEVVEEPSHPQDQRAAPPEHGIDQSRRPRLGCGASCWLKPRPLSDLPLKAARTIQQTPASHPVAQLYTPMPPSHMRLMLFFKGYPEDPIRCALADEPPSEPPLDPERDRELHRKLRYGYEALSYVWAPATRAVPLKSPRLSSQRLLCRPR